MDYGHPLKFGAFVTPANASPQAPVETAQLVESLGFDLVTFQDHPYQPSFLDTWTLISYVAARTDRIHIAPNVMNVPLRNPAVAARAASSLDLLSGGRIDMALGAGAFWDAVVAMGVPRLTPGESITALEEAIDIMRGIWDAGNRHLLRLDGSVHSVRGAQRGPLAAHDIPIWIGALKPRGLRLIGRKANGWLPSLGYLQPGDFARGNATIDKAAVSAGRDPREIRRLANITVPQTGLDGWAEQLATLALEDGASTFILANDSAMVLQLFAEEVMPAVRELVATERARTGLEPAEVKSAAAVAARRSGIDYDAAPEGVRVIEPGDYNFSSVKSTYMRGGSPGLVLQPSTVEEVVESVEFARTHRHLELAVRSGGHGISGRSTNDGGLVIDLKELNSIEILDREAKTVRIGPGARWSDVATVLGDEGWALSSGDYGGVGVGGLATAGGVGWLARQQGLTIDHLIAADIVLADGSLVHTSAEENPELFWAIRGAGANMGIVVSFDFVVEEVADIGFAQLGFDPGNMPELLERWGAAMEEAPRDLTTELAIVRQNSAPYVGVNVLGAVASDEPDTILNRLQPLAEIAPLTSQSVQLLPYSALMGNASPAPHSGRGEPVSASGLIEHLTPDVAEALARFIESGASTFIQIRCVGGAVSDVAADATAYAHRSANFAISAGSSNAQRLAKEWAKVKPFLSGTYLSFETSLDPERIHDAFPPPTLSRLRDIKARVDPQGLFRDNFSVIPAAQA
ncbi:LLM class flavin-dependent oxidoreductase [Salinibacterium sp. SWN248]|uniref:LLM class flavin-dependent oxidoreductase n=1 Tax=Salinibacterium sp. SWN248 TaxID=2792056 RepID=UPI0018CDFA19|nr:LLM class flavin-dependent oxidoreductase [Salinibacterium sp. SWN248]MBH0022817.1 LLM class flavin-dependent oxidoreductase [Salinibacterium sp. SWN248]